MKKSNNTIETPTQLSIQLKQYMKMKSITRIKITEFKHFNHSSSMQDSMFGRIMHYLHTKSKFDQNKSTGQLATVLKAVLNEDRISGNKYEIDNDWITYISKYSKIVDEKTLMLEIQNTPEGLLVDQELLKFSHVDIRNIIENLIYMRSVLPVKSKGIDKSKIKQSNYEGYYLFSYPPEIKEIQSTLFCPVMQKRQFESLSRNLQERQEKLKKLYRTKISNYRKEFENICSANVNRGQSKGGQQQNSESLQKIFASWNEINKLSVPNFDREAEQWFKNRK